MKFQPLTIEPCAIPGIYKFHIGGLDISRHIDGAEVMMFQDDADRMKLIIRSSVMLPDEYKLILFKEKSNGRDRDRHAERR